MTAFILPDLGEGLKGAELVEWCVKEGQSVKLDELVLLVETAKAVVELPSPASGVITRLAYAEGDTVKVGEILFEYEENTGEAADLDSMKNQQDNSKAINKKSVSVVGELAQSESEIANNFEMDECLHSPQNRSQTSSDSDIRSTNNEQPVCINAYKESKILKVNTEHQRTKNQIALPPKVMAFAKKLGLQDSLDHSFSDELTLHELLQIYQRRIIGDAHKASVDNDFIELKSNRKVMADVMTKSHNEIAAATIFEDANISSWPEKSDITLNVIKALTLACSQVPIMNAWFKAETMSVQKIENVDLGLAVNSERGLFVPVIRQVNKKKDSEIRKEINSFKLQIEDSSILAKDLLGASISLSNFGGYSGRYATPLIVPPQVCIVGTGKVRQEPIVQKNEIKIGKILPISISFDHRVITGVEAARFMKCLIKELEGS